MNTNAHEHRWQRPARLAPGWLARLTVALAIGATTASVDAAVPALQPPFDQTYTVVDLGSVPSVPAGYGALSVPPYDPSWLVVVGSVDTINAALYANQTARDASGHIVSFNPTTLPYAATPTPLPTPTPTSAVAECAPAPLVGCAVPGKSTIGLYGNANDPRKTKLDWKWLKGSASLAAFGDPIGGSANYRVCVYDDDALRIGLAVAAGGACDGKPCWKASRAGLKFQSSKHPNADGVGQLALHPGAGSASIALHAKGANLPSPFPVADTTSVTVQLVKNPGAGSECWSATFPAPAKTSGPVKLKLADRVP